LAAETPGAFIPGQFDNPANPEVHYRTTGPEIVHALGGEPVHAFVAAVGTGGTVSGAGRALKEKYPECRVIAVEPDACATISRGERGPTKIQGLAAGFVPQNYDASVVDEVRTVTDRDAYETKRALGREEGVLVGLSAGANVFVALQVARELGPGKSVVTLLCDTGERYFSLDEYFSGPSAWARRAGRGPLGAVPGRGSRPRHRGRRARLPGSARSGASGRRAAGPVRRRPGARLEPPSADPLRRGRRRAGQA